MTPSPPLLNRDLSWLSFNYRILQAARQESLPLYDRIRFLAIYSSNLDEFFRVRVAALRSLTEIKKKKLAERLTFDPQTVLDAIGRLVPGQQDEYGQVWRHGILPALAGQQVTLYGEEPPLPEHRREIDRLFRGKVLSYLQPVVWKAGGGQAPFLNNREIYLALEVWPQPETGAEAGLLAFLNVPVGPLDRFVRLSPVQGRHYLMFLEDVIRQHLPLVFPGYRVGGCYSVKLNRDADFTIDDELNGDLVRKIREQLEKRKTGKPTRFLYDSRMPAALLARVAESLGLQPGDLVAGGRYHNLHELAKLPNPRYPQLEEPPLTPLTKLSLEAADTIFAAIDGEDQLLHFPYHSYEYVLRFFNEAAIDPRVEALKVTLYRVAADSLIANALISAARNGKRVTVFVEVKARFDEENNLRWAAEMEAAGVRILYSLPGLKVHAKIALVKRRRPDGRRVWYGYLGTGNFNERTATLYSDCGLLTRHPATTRELGRVFAFLEGKKARPAFRHLLVAGFNMKERLLGLLDREIGFARRGRPGRVVIKLNNLEEDELIAKLYEASRAGVTVDLLVRGICCLVPQHPLWSPTIRAFRLVDRFLEHARIFYFSNGGAEEIYLSSADWMTRNLHRRIEVGFPVLSPGHRHELVTLLELQLADNTRLCGLDGEGRNVPVAPPAGDGELPVRAQEDFYRWLAQREQTGEKLLPGE
jgi:polyphosphate kinase